ncbi:MAG: hypothetical protein LUG50_10030 [Planctomycetaceae bacterium]|nr:hypothetical protein [Planctomycetaceae bacterium]
MIQPVLRTLGALVLAVSLMATANAAESDTVASDDALPYLNLDFENNQGWIATVKGGYQWKLFRNVGVDMVSGGQNVFSRERNFTKPGGAASIGLGYNFGERFPVTVGVVFGIGPSGKLDQYGTATVGTDTYDVFTRQKISVYTLDASIDYDFKNCSRWTPFVGAIVGVGFMKDRGHSTFTSADGTRYTGEYGKKNRTTSSSAAGSAPNTKLMNASPCPCMVPIPTWARCRTANTTSIFPTPPLSMPGPSGPALTPLTSRSG